MAKKLLTVTSQYEVLVDENHDEVKSYRDIDEFLSAYVESNFKSSAVTVLSTDVFDYDILN